MLKRAAALVSVGIFAKTGIAANTSFPNRPIKILVPFAAGGGTDIMARLIAAEMSKELGQSVVVDNKAGAGGSLGADLVARSPADGYTLLLGTASTHAINPEVYSKLPFDPIKSFTPISLIASIPGVVAVNGNSTFHSLQDLVAEMRRQPGKLTFGSQGQGGLSHLMGEMFNAQAQVKSVHVPYRGGAQALQDVVAGNVDVLYDTLPAVLPHLQSGALRALAITAEHRSPAFPNLPTSGEQGYPQFLAQTWNALFGPANLPVDIAQRLTQAVMKAVSQPGVKARIEAMSAVPVGSDARALSSMLQKDRQRWAAAVKAAGVKID